MLYTLNIYNVICQLYLDKVEGKGKWNKNQIPYHWTSRYFIIYWHYRWCLNEYLCPYCLYSSLALSRHYFLRESSFLLSSPLSSSILPVKWMVFQYSCLHPTQAQQSAGHALRILLNNLQDFLYPLSIVIHLSKIG